jgi:hypothetical protein
MLGVYAEYWAFPIRIGHFFLTLGVFIEYRAFSICIGQSFYFWAFIQGIGHFIFGIGHFFLFLGVKYSVGSFWGFPFHHTFWANVEDSGLRFASLCLCGLCLGRGYRRVEFQCALD